MRTLWLALFISLGILIYGSLNFYLIHKGWRALEGSARVWRLSYAILASLLAASFFAGRFLERAGAGPSGLLIWAGSFWLAVLLYGLLAAALCDLSLLAAGLFRLKGLQSLLSSAAWRTWAFAAIAVLILTVTAAGYFNACRIRLRALRVEIPRPEMGIDSLTVTLVTDIHLGTIVGNGRLGRLVEQVNATDPDLVLLAGDIVDEDIAPVIRQDMGKKLSALRSRRGVWGITGNHEYIGGVKEALSYLEAHGIRMLVDQKAEIVPGLWLAGRNDRSAARFAGSPRKPLSELLEGLDGRGVVILMDHQPFNLEEAAGNGVDLQLSGHTHHGQLWPLSLITNRIYEKSWGYLRKGDTHYYVSSGAGTWGPPVRIGNHPEVVKITLRFKD
jgi:hypothetical protein